MRVLMVENIAGTSPGLVGRALEEAGADIHLCRPWAGEVLPQDARDHDAMVVFGGEQNALDDKEHPYLPELVRLMVGFGEVDKPVLGICLGSQLLARAHGGSNLIGTAPEFGWHHIEPTAAGLADPVLSAAGERFPIFLWHSDTFSLPEGAVHLASNSAVSNQAFRVGRASYGTQFHFEANVNVVAEWSKNFRTTINAMSPGWIDDFAHHRGKFGALSDAAGLNMARAWVKLIG